MARKTRKKTSAPKAPVTKALSVVLADLYVLAVKTHGFHWNVEGPLFPQLHDLFGKQYEALLGHADEVAERIRALGDVAPASFAQFLKLTRLNEAGSPSSAQAMVAELLADYDLLTQDAKAGIEIADDADDDGSEDLLIGLTQETEKSAWMLRAMLKGR